MAFTLDTSGSHKPKGVVSAGHAALYGSWANMRTRCSNPKASRYDRYGGRGITVCPEWDSFSAFQTWALANGWAPGLSIDRIDNDGNYEPGNCRWATPAEQRRNKPDVPKDASGRAYVDVASDHGVSQGAYKCRVRLGWPPRLAATTPNLGKKGARRTRLADVLRNQEVTMTPFATGYTEALRQSLPAEHRDTPLAPATLSRIIGDCERYEGEHRILQMLGGGERAFGRDLWTDRQDGKLPDYPVLTVSLGEDGLIYLSEAGQ